MNFQPFRRRLLALALLSAITGVHAQSGEISLLNVSYDPTRELYQAFNPEFSRYWKEKTGQVVSVKQSHGGAGKQKRDRRDVHGWVILDKPIGMTSTHAVAVLKRLAGNKGRNAR